MWRAIALVVLLTMLFSLQPVRATDMSLLSYFDELVSRAVKAEKLANDLQGSLEISSSELRSVRQESTSLRLRVEALKKDLDASKISEEQAWKEARTLSGKITTLESLLSEAVKRSEKLALENAALILDRDRWKAEADKFRVQRNWLLGLAAVLGGSLYLMTQAYNSK
jgi:chromosome segregation ATPase